MPVTRRKLEETQQRLLTVRRRGGMAVRHGFIDTGIGSSYASGSLKVEEIKWQS
jgi:hypothetical protein